MHEGLASLFEGCAFRVCTAFAVCVNSRELK